DVERGGETETDFVAFVLPGVEAGNLERERVCPGRDGREAVLPFRVGHRRLDAHHRGAVRRDGDARKNSTARVRNPPVDGAGGARSEERRVGKEGRCRWWRGRQQKKKEEVRWM